MALTTSNYTLEGVLGILAQSTTAIGNFRATALKGASTRDQLLGEIQRIERRENELLSVFGGKQGLEQRIADFKRDASNFSGAGLGINFTWPYGQFIDKVEAQFQKDFETIFLTAVGEELGIAAHEVGPQMVLNYLNSHKKDLNIVGVLTENGTRLTKVANVKSTKGMSEESGMIVKRMTGPVRRRIQASINTLKKDPKYKGLLTQTNVQVDNGNNFISATAGAVWARTVSQLTPEQINKLTPAELKKINNHIIDSIINGLKLSKYKTIAKRIIQTQMLTQNPYMFFKSKGNLNDITGLIGEICAMILFYDLTHTYPSIAWAATHKDLSGNQDSADIIIEEGLGIQVKNTTQDLESLKGLEVSFKNVNLSTLGESLGFNNKIIENLYDTQTYNTSYTWNHSGEHTSFMEGGNARFSSAESMIENLINQFEMVMTSYAADLMYMASSGTSVKMYSGDVGNVLYMVALKPYYATEILQNIINTLNNSQEDRSLLFSAYRENSTTRNITADLPGIYQQTGKGVATQFGKGSMKFKTSYVFQ